MKAYRIHISSWTASFRFPNMISGFQPSLPVPPLSAIWGLFSAAMGQWILPSGKKLGYIFSSQAKAEDQAETVYQFAGKNQAKSNVIRREFLVDNNLWLYTEQGELAKAMKKPYFPLLLGRSGDLASVHEVREIELEEKENLSHLKGTILPFDEGILLPSPMQALPVCFSEQIPRRSLKVKPFFMLDSNYKQTLSLSKKGAFDPDYEREIFWHED